MPTITVDGPGIRDIEKKRLFVKTVTDAAIAAFGLPKDAFVVVIKENAPDNVAVGGVLLVDRK